VRPGHHFALLLCAAVLAALPGCARTDGERDKALNEARKQTDVTERQLNRERRKLEKSTRTPPEVRRGLDQAGDALDDAQRQIEGAR